jgi:exopolysaccharide biosynthesis polyprenyl glycosylphosphotransferase
VVGHEVPVLEMLRRLGDERFHGLQIVAACLPLPGQRPALMERGVPVVGGFGSVEQAVRLTDADTVAVLASPDLGPEQLRRLAWDLEPTGADLLVAPSLVEVAGPRLSIRPVTGLPLLQVEQPQFTGGRRIVKSTFDRTVALAMIVLFSPVLVAITLGVRLTSRGPALFRQQRIGKDGKPFTMWKFRSMVVDAEALREQLLEQSDRDGLMFKMRADPRVTRVGAWLRRYSLDELPQLFNVLTGSMSLVGPRPPLPEEVAEYGDDTRRRLLVRPGVTGLWQVSGRADLSWEESVRLDLRYVDNWTLATDLLILWKTARAVLRGSGAY